MKEWMLPVFIVVVWIVQYILRNRENDEPVRAARGKAGDRPANRSPGSEIDRFLQEIERMKKKSAEDRPEPPKANRAPLPKVLPAVGKPPRVRWRPCSYHPASQLDPRFRAKPRCLAGIGCTSVVRDR